MGSIPFLRFLEAATKKSVQRSWRDGRTYVIEEPPDKEDKAPHRIVWPSGRLHLKLNKVKPKVSIPLLWKLCRYYDTPVEEETSKLLRDYVQKKRGVRLETVPFYLVTKYSRLHTCCKLIGSKPQSSFKKIRITVDKNDLTVILLPHREVAEVLLRRLEEVAL